jgi:hypothetical protein
MGTKTIRQSLTLITLGLPVIVLLVSYGAIATHTVNPWPWLEVVHESGNRTLLGTVLYFEHAARELPLDVVLSVAIGESALWALPRNGITSRHHQFLLPTSIALVIGVIILGTLFTSGSAALWDNLLQMQTRPGKELSFGSHWRYHLLSRLMLMLASLGVAGMVVVALRSKGGKGSKAGQRVFVLVLGIYIGLSIAFGLNLKPFIDPVFLGHQAREAFTHGLVTLPLAWLLCLALSGKAYESGNGTVTLRWPMAAGIAGIIITIYLLAGALLTSAVSHGQTENLALLIFPHFFEHSFTYLLVPLIAVLTYKMLIQSSRA